MRTTLGMLIVAFGLLCSSMPAIAHHSFALDYDSSKTFTFKGTVTKVEWTNPHSRIYVDVADEKGVVTNWNLELGGNRSTLTRAGWTSKTLKVGDQIMVSGVLARTDVPRGQARSVVTADGRSLFAGEAASDYR